MAFMKLYEVSGKLADAIDEETGEILIPEEEFEELIKAEEQGVDHFIGLYKNAKATAAALKDEKKTMDANFDSRIKAAERVAEHAEFVLKMHLKGNKYESSVGSIKYRKSTRCEATDLSQFMKWDGRLEYLAYADPKPKLDDITEAIKSGELIPGFALVDYQNMNIK